MGDFMWLLWTGAYVEYSLQDTLFVVEVLLSPLSCSSRIEQCLLFSLVDASSLGISVVLEPRRTLFLLRDVVSFTRRPCLGWSCFHGRTTVFYSHCHAMHSLESFHTTCRKAWPQISKSVTNNNLLTRISKTLFYRVTMMYCHESWTVKWNTW